MKNLLYLNFFSFIPYTLFSQLTITSKAYIGDSCNICGKYEREYSYIEIKKDHTFFSESADALSNGTWDKYGDTILLRSNYKRDDIKIEVKEDKRKFTGKNKKGILLYWDYEGLGANDFYLVFNGDTTNFKDNQVYLYYQYLPISPKKIAYLQFYSP